MDTSKQIPGPGRIIHTTYPNYPKDSFSRAECRPAIVTGLDHSEEKMYVTIFSPNLAPQQAVLHYYANGWHWPTDIKCPCFISPDEKGL